MTFVDWIRGIAPVGRAFVVALVIGGGLVGLYGWVRGRLDDAFQPIGSESPPPPHVSPFASPRTRTEAPPQAAEGEVKP